MPYECDNDNHDIGCQCPGVAPAMTDAELRAWLSTIKYQNDVIIWALSGGKPDRRPMPPYGVVETRHPGGETTIQPEGIAP